MWTKNYDTSQGFLPSKKVFLMSTIHWFPVRRKSQVCPQHFSFILLLPQKVLDREIDSVDGLDKDDDDNDGNGDNNDDDNDGKLVHTEGLGRLPLMMAAPSGGQ